MKASVRPVSDFAGARVAVIGKYNTEAFAVHISETFEQGGADVARINPEPDLNNEAPPLIRKFSTGWNYFRSAVEATGRWRRRRFRTEILQPIREFKPDIILSTHDRFLLPEEATCLRKSTSARLALWFPDHFASLGRAHCALGDYDALFFKDPYMVHSLRVEYGLNSFYLPEAFNPRRHRWEGPDPSVAAEIGTAGSLHAFRAALLKQLKRYTLVLAGHGPPRWMPLDGLDHIQRIPFVAYEEKARFFLSVKIVLNSLYPAEVAGLNARAFEAAGIGAFQLLNWRPGLADLFDVGREVVAFRSVPELLELLDHYLERDDERAQIAAAGKARALSEHTYSHRLKLMVQTLDGSAAGFPCTSSQTAPQAGG